MKLFQGHPDIDAGVDRWTSALWEEAYGERPVKHDPDDPYTFYDDIEDDEIKE